MGDNVHPVVLTVPRNASSLSAMRLVIGWVASCNDLPLDQIDDINLAIETVVSGEPGLETGEGSELTLAVSAENGEFQVLLGGLTSPELRNNLQAGGEATLSGDWPLDIRIFIRALMDDCKVVGCSGDTFSVSMKKRFR